MYNSYTTGMCPLWSAVVGTSHHYHSTTTGDSYILSCLVTTTTLNLNASLIYMLSIIQFQNCTSYSKVVLYIWDHAVLGFLACPKISSLNNFLHNSLAVYWLGIAKPKNAFRVTPNPSNKFLQNFKNSDLTEFSTD